MKKLLAFILLAIALASPAYAATSGTMTTNETDVITAKGYDTTRAITTLYVTGTWGGGTLTVEASPNGTTWVTVPNISWTADTIANVEFRWVALRITLAGATNPNLTWQLLTGE
jgi:opacity protein-like surface antigen